MNSDTNSVVERSTQALNGLREQIKALSKQGHYEAYKESFQAQQPMEVPQEIAEQFKDQFTVKNFKEDMAAVFPVLYRLMKESELGYDDIVAMTQEEIQTEDEDFNADRYDPFAKFEQWAMNLGEESAIQSQDEEEQAAAAQQLQELVSQAFPAGVDGSNAIESLKGIIDDPRLEEEIKTQSKEDPEADVRGLVQVWLEANAPEVLEVLDFGDFQPEPVGGEPATDQGGEETAPEEVPQESEEQSPEEHSGKMNVQELAEFMHSFYDKDSGTFPKGPEGVCTMVGKKFGEQAETVARKMAERMAPQQQAPEPAENPELARIKALSGMYSM
jgi:hypothetical protein